MAAKAAAKVATVPLSAPVEYEWNDELEELTVYIYRGAIYYISNRNELWEMNKDRTFGNWVGVYNPLTDEIDTSAPEPLIF